MAASFDDRDWGRRGSPSYVKVRDWLLDHITEHRLGPGDRVPSERVLADSLGLSRPTIARAILELVEQGVLTRERGNGTFVAQRATRRRADSGASVAMLIPFGKHEALSDPRDQGGDRSWTEGIGDMSMHGVLSVLKEAGCRLVVHHTNSSEEEIEILSNMSSEGLQGAVVLSYATPEAAKRYSKLAYTGPPVVFVDRYIPGLPIDRVVTDNVAGARAGVTHLISKGRRRIAYLTNFADVTSIVDREAGYRAALDDAGIPYDEDIVCGPEIARHGRLAFDHQLAFLMGLPQPVDAVFCMNDDMVWSVVQAAHRFGLSVPGELEIAGFFDSTPPRAILGSVTRVVQAKFEIGQIAARLLLERMHGEAPTEPRHVLVPPHLMPAAGEERYASTQAVPAAEPGPAAR